MKQNIVIMNFSGIYKEEQFYEGEQVSWLDFTEIAGTNCYCDEEAQIQILGKMENYPVSGIYFIDSGNYHYMSRIGARRVGEPFNLLVFDNHTDMQLPAFGGLLSCGGWIASALEEVKNLQEVWLVGPDEEAYGQVEEQFKSRVHFLSREKLAAARSQNGEKACQSGDLGEVAGNVCQPGDLGEVTGNTGNGQKLLSGYLDKWFSEIPADLPLYVSIDKDVLCQEDAATTWSQGDMTLEEMLKALFTLCSNYEKENGKILRVDICGECDPDESLENHRNDHSNKELLKFWKEYFGRVN